MSKLVELKVIEFVDLLASDAPAPGGGSVAALAGAQAAALMAMVCRLTIGKKKYVEVEAEVKAALEQLEILRVELMHLVDADTEAYNAFGAAMTMPKDTDEQKAVRQSAMKAATKLATEVPAQTMAASAKVAEYMVGLYAKTNKNCLSDVGTGLRMVQAAITGASLNVAINLPVTGDENFNRHHADKAREIQDRFLPQIETAIADIARQLS